MGEYCPFCYNEDEGIQFECTDCKFCTMYYRHDGRIYKKRGNINPMNTASSKLGWREREYKREIMEGNTHRDSGINDIDGTVPTSYYPMSDKEAEEACRYDYDFADLMTTGEIEERLTEVISDLQLKGRRLF